MNLRVLGVEELAESWGLIKLYVDRALVHGSGSVTSHGLFMTCMQAGGQCWVREDEFGTIQGVCITRFEMYEKTKVLGIAAMTAEGWFDFGPGILQILEEFAAKMDCQKVAVYGRRGWKKTLDKYGYKEPYTVLMKEVEPWVEEEVPHQKQDSPTGHDQP